ncbi:hypothetical protein EB796_023519 [Bugula neritina]|uniref:Uncharacterized protein n=1 Tax=Bugula neritina TaxID=10212 RepID=A0A7J7IWG8_BUGNE|nr:hypothetical protein EB796_023519 [Bugula neritina]
MTLIACPVNELDSFTSNTTLQLNQLVQMRSKSLQDNKSQINQSIIRPAGSFLAPCSSTICNLHDYLYLDSINLQITF